MDVETIRLLYQYNDWVNQVLLDVTEQVPADRLHDSFGTSFESIHGTLVHILGAEISWLGRWQGASPPRRLNPTDVPNLLTRTGYPPPDTGLLSYYRRVMGS